MKIIKKFILACESGNVEKVKELVELGVDVNVYKGCAIIYAVQKGHLSTLEYLLSKGADLSKIGYNCLVEAAGRNQLKIVEFLVDRGYVDTFWKEEAIKNAIVHENLDVVNYINSLEV